MYVCHSGKAMREADAKDTSGELGSAFPGSLVGKNYIYDCKAGNAY